MQSLPNGYAEHAPPACLRERVACFWTRLAPPPSSPAPYSHPYSNSYSTPDPNPDPNSNPNSDPNSNPDSHPNSHPNSHSDSHAHTHPVRVLPDNCLDIIFTFDADGLARATGVGAMTRPLLVAGPAPRLTIGVRFRPGNGRAAFGLPAGELTDATVPWTELTSDAQAELERVAAVATDRGKLEAMMALVERRLRGAATSPRYIREAVRQLESAAGGVRIAELADGLGVSRQQLARQFAIHVGVSPKTFARVARMRATLARADAARAAHPRPIAWSALAFELGYADQPHMIEEMRALAGLTPTEWEKTRGGT